VTRVQIGHTPDADDAFMFFGINNGQSLPPDISVEHLLLPMQNLNQMALQGHLEMTAFSFATFAQVAHLYRPLPCGLSLGFATGPMLVVRPGTTLEQVRQGRVASPGSLTSAHWLTLMWNPDQQFSEVPFDQVLTRLLDGEVCAALVIFEAQMRLAELGCQMALDLGHWWHQETQGLPVPLGLNGVRRDLPLELQVKLGGALRDSIQLALDHPQEALDQALPLARGLERSKTLEFVNRYVHRSTLDLGPGGRLAVAEFYRRSQTCGLLEKTLEIDWLPLDGEVPGGK
jgi:1,4-dihydroxy-6-naphthoate synthase